MFPPTLQHLAAPEVWEHQYFLLRLALGPLHPLQFRISPAFGYLQTFVTLNINFPFAPQSLPDTRPYEVLLSPMNSNVRTRCTSDCHAILCQVRPRSTATTWRHKEVENLKTRTFVLRHPGAFTTLSVVIMRMLLVRAWCPRYRPTHN